jgi:hypothetical protein
LFVGRAHGGSAAELGSSVLCHAVKRADEFDGRSIEGSSKNGDCSFSEITHTV